MKRREHNGIRFNLESGTHYCGRHCSVTYFWPQVHSQMTIGQTVLMIAVGTLLIQPVANKNLWQTLLLSFILVLTLFLFELLALKWNFFEGVLRGRSKVVIENGILKISTMKKLRLTVDELEMHLRQSGIERIDDVKWATIEMSGQLGYVLIDRKQYATKEGHCSNPS